MAKDEAKPSTHRYGSDIPMLSEGFTLNGEPVEIVRTVAKDEVDRDFLAWAKEHADHDHETMAQALAETEHLMRRPRKLQAETVRALLRRCVAWSMQRGFPKSAAVIDIRDKMKKKYDWIVSERTIWNALLVWRRGKRSQ
jgi:hypothetical protein